MKKRPAGSAVCRLAKGPGSRLDSGQAMKFVVQKDAEPFRLTDELFYLALLGVMAAALAAIITSFALVLHRNFLTIACDTAVLQDSIVNTIHGHWYGQNGNDYSRILGAHTTFLLLLLVPIYVISPSVDTLFTLQIWGVYSTVIPIYLVAQQMLRRPHLAFCIAASVLISPMLLHMAIAPLHLETWIIAAAFWAYYFYRRNSMIGFCVSALFAVCCGEQAALIFVALGAALLLIPDGLDWRKRFGLVSLLGGLGWVLLAVLVVAPIARSGHNFNIFAYNYTQWNIKSVSELPGAVVQQPRVACGFLFNLYRWQHMAELLGIPLICALLSWRSFILLAPFPVYFLMCDQEFFLYFHAYYYSFFFFAGYMGLIFFLARREGIDRFGISIVALTVLFNAILLCPASYFYINLAECRDDAFTGTLRQAFSEIPKNATVYGPHRYSAYLSNHENFVLGDLKDEHFDFDIMMDAQYAYTNVHPEQFDYIVVDCLTDQCGCRMGGYDPAVSQRRSNNINSLIQSGEWQMVFNQKNTVILHRVGR